MHPYISFTYADQLYRVTGTSGTAERVQYIGGDNLPLNIHRETLVNSISIAVPLAVAPQLMHPDVLADIKENGVYRQPFDTVQEPLMISTVQRDLFYFLKEHTLSRVQQRAQSIKARVWELSHEEIAKALVGRPDIKIDGQSYFTILRTIRDCATQAYTDGYKILFNNHAEVGTFACERVGGDGQLVLLISYLKRRFGRRYKNVLIDSGDFHAFAHLMLALHELYWHMVMCCLVEVLEITNVDYTKMRDLQNNNYGKLLALNHAVGVAIVIYFTKYVENPSPQLLYANPAAYLQQINSAGGIVLFRWLQFVGSPVFTYQFALRSGTGALLPKLHAYAFHVHRCVHKTQEVRIMLIALVSFFCIHPALQAFKLHMCGLSLLGTVYMAYDRVVEWVNARQSERNSSFHASDSSLQFTPHLQSMLHVDAAYSAAALGLTPDADRGFDPRILRQVDRLLDLFLTRSGRDLTIASPNNPYHHTGNAVPLMGGSAEERRTWEYFEAVARGQSAGKGADRQSSGNYIHEYLRDHMFTM